jgi:GT2 family glycosyltransferase/glycosyltransferase involved in cell wall biosynthesis
MAIEGHVDGFEEGCILGWAFDPAFPDFQITVEVFVDSFLLGEVIADQYRLDLLEAGKGSGNHHFRLPIMTSLIDNRRHEVKVIDKITKTIIPSQDSRFLFLDKLNNRSRGEIDPHELFKLFDQGFYLQQTGPVEESPLAHYMKHGWREGHNPHPLFDTKYYCYVVGEDLYADPLTHFFEVGQFKNVCFHPLFDHVQYFRSRPDVLRAKKHPLLHYLEGGWKETPFPSIFFSEKYYEENCPGIREADFPPIIHYLVNGYKEGRKPHPDFNPRIFSKCANLDALEEPLTVFVRDMLTDPDRGAPARETRVSIIILNLQKTLTTLQCLFFLRKYTDLEGVEVLVVDNGSSPENFALLCKHASPCQVLRIGVNRGFGEANNIGVEYASGEILVFLNNDAFVTDHWLSGLETVLRSNPSIGAVGPRFLYPDGSLQEAGAMIGSDGTAVQRGKHLDPRDPLFSQQEEVDYCSAATLMLWKDLFIQVLGFDLCWDPAYYEDADLSLKLRLLGKRTIYTPDVEIVHLENATSSDQSLDLRLHNVVRANRMKFVARWGRYLAKLPDEIERDLLNRYVGLPEARGSKTLGLYTPYPLTAGGGERYLLSIAAACKDEFHCTLLTDDRYSRLRLLTLGRELDLDVGHIELALWSEFRPAGPFDVFVCMGNEVLPPAHCRGLRNFHHCQFPFPLLDGHFVRDWGKLEDYDGIIVNSRFTAWHVAAQSRTIGVTAPPVHVIFPPAPQMTGGSEGWEKSEVTRILHVGRFAPGGHCKRQDVMIEVFRKLVSKNSPPIELHLAGSLGGSSSDREYLLSLQDAARGLPVFFHINISARKMRALYRFCSIYWHITGILNNVELEPEKFEHFGITIVEAMSAGLIPIVLRHGGPSEIIKDGENGFLIDTASDLEAQTLYVLSLSEDELGLLREMASVRAAKFEFAEFQPAMLNLFRFNNETIDEKVTGVTCGL